MKKLVKIVLGVLVGVTMTGLVSPIGVVYADVPETVCDDPQISDELKKAAGCETAQQAPDVAQTLINVVLSLAGVVAVGVMIYGGFLYMTSAGDLSKLQRGKHTLIYGVVGLLVCVLAAAIVNFVIVSTR